MTVRIIRGEHKVMIERARQLFRQRSDRPYILLVFEGKIEESTAMQAGTEVAYVCRCDWWYAVDQAWQIWLALGGSSDLRTFITSAEDWQRALWNGEMIDAHKEEIAVNANLQVTATPKTLLNGEEFLVFKFGVA